MNNIPDGTGFNSSLKDFNHKSSDEILCQLAKKQYGSVENTQIDVNLLIAHNIDFDYPILNCEFKRLNLESNLNKLSRFCTMKTNEICLFCDLGRDGKKWPKLKELHIKLFGSSFANAHSAFVDAKITAKCFLELKRRRIIFKDN